MVSLQGGTLKNSIDHWINILLRDAALEGHQCLRRKPLNESRAARSYLYRALSARYIHPPENENPI
jgi:hypothetical protein